MEVRKRIALVAHDNKKVDLLDWVRFNRLLLVRHELTATGTTGQLLEDELGIPIIMVTAKTSATDFADAKAAGVDDYVTKPFSIVKLIERIDFLLKRAEETAAGLH